MQKHKVLLIDLDDAILDNIINCLDEQTINYELELYSKDNIYDTYGLTNVDAEFTFTNEQDKLHFILKWK